jgi:hypothetical protein
MFRLLTNSYMRLISLSSVVYSHEEKIVSLQVKTCCSYLTKSDATLQTLHVLEIIYNYIYKNFWCFIVWGNDEQYFYVLHYRPVSFTKLFMHHVGPRLTC